MTTQIGHPALVSELNAILVDITRETGAYFEDLEGWRQSKNGRATAYIYTLGSSRVDPVKFDIELNVRLTKAFEAGWDAHSKRVDAVIVETIDNLAEWVHGPEPMLDRP